MADCDWVDFAASFVTIVTGLVAVGAYGKYWVDRVRKSKRVVEYLKDQKNTSGNKGQRTVMHLSVHLGLTESEVLQAAFDCRSIRRLVGANEKGDASVLYLEYRTKNDAAP